MIFSMPLEMHEFYFWRGDHSNIAVSIFNNAMLVYEKYCYQWQETVMNNSYSYSIRVFPCKYKVTMPDVLSMFAQASIIFLNVISLLLQNPPSLRLYLSLFLSLSLTPSLSRSLPPTLETLK